MVSQGGTLTYRARSDGSPYSVINQARGVYTALPGTGAKVGCGGVLYRVDDRPVLLLCGTVPAYRDSHVGDEGRDVRQLNRNLHVRGAGDAFTTRTEPRSSGSSAARGLTRPASSRSATPSSSRGGPDRQGRRRARGPARPGAPDRSGHGRRAAGAGGPRRVAAGRGEEGRPGAGDAAGQHAGEGEGRPVRRVAQAPQGKDAEPAAPPSRVHQARRPGRGARARQGPGPGGRHDQGRGERPERPRHRAGRQGRRRARGRGGAGRRATRAGRGEGWASSTTGTGASRSKARFDESEHVVVPSSMSDDGSGAGRGDEGVRRAAAGVGARGVSFSVRRGELVAIVGPSGSGKSTLLHVIGTLERPSGGVVRIDGVDAAGLGDRELSLLRARGDRVRVPAVLPRRARHGAGERRRRDALRRRPGRRAVRRARTRRSSGSASRIARPSSPPSSPEASGSASRSPAPSSGARRSCSRTSRPATSTAPPARRSWQLIRELNAAGATIVLITHDAGLADQLPRQIRMLDGQVVSDA